MSLPAMETQQVAPDDSQAIGMRLLSPTQHSDDKVAKNTLGKFDPELLACAFLLTALQGPDSCQACAYLGQEPSVIAV